MTHEKANPKSHPRNLALAWLAHIGVNAYSFVRCLEYLREGNEQVLHIQLLGIWLFGVIGAFTIKIGHNFRARLIFFLFSFLAPMIFGGMFVVESIQASLEPQAQLRRVIEEGKNEQLEDLLHKGIMKQNEIQYSLLTAIRCDNTDALALLAGQGADVNLAVGGVNLPLNRAVEENVPRVVQTLLDLGADINGSDIHGQTPLHTAVKERKRSLLGQLLEAGADPNAFDNRGYPPANYTDEEEILKILADAGGRRVEMIDPREGITSLHAAVKADDRDLVKEILTEGFPPVDVVDAQDRTPLMYAAREGLTDMVRILLDGGADVNAETPQGSSALFAAAYSGSANVCRLLLDRGADLSVFTEGYSPLNIAVENGHSSLFTLFLEQGFAIADETIELAYENENLALRKLVLEGAIQSQEFDLNSLIFPALKNGDLTTLFHLAEKGVDFNTRGSHGLTAAHYLFADSSSDPRLIRFILEQQTDLTVQDYQSYTPLDYAVMNDNLSGFNTLWSFIGEEISPEQLNLTFLHSVEFASPATMARLLTLGADIHFVETGSTDPVLFHLPDYFDGIEVAVEREKALDDLEQCIAILVQAGADPDESIDNWTLEDQYGEDSSVMNIIRSYR